jgi:phosphoglycerate dehydrogenase-like enzyme
MRVIALRRRADLSAAEKADGTLVSARRRRHGFERGGGARSLACLPLYTIINPDHSRPKQPNHPLPPKKQDAVYTPDQICDLMAASDYVVAATPYTPETDKLVSAAAIAAMRPTGVFINLGRGRCVDEDALVEALTHRRIRGAALDVFATEPLPAASPLWKLPNVLMSPHCADRTKDFQFESLAWFVDNAGRYLRGEPLLAACDKRAGY